MIMKIVFILLILMSMQQINNSSEVVFGGGCFWCTEAIFNQLNGVIDVSPGYSGGITENPTYEEVCGGETGHAEVVRIEYNPNEIDYKKLLEVFFLTHDPTTLNRQGADRGTQYRSVVFYTTPDQKRITLEIIEKLNNSKAFKNQIVTEVLPLKKFFLAEDYHQNYFSRNKNQPYCQIVIQPKMDKFKETFGGIIKK
jgi:peptide-methionine (S)-S-oxide reductase